MEGKSLTYQDIITVYRELELPITDDKEPYELPWIGEHPDYGPIVPNTSIGALAIGGSHAKLG